MSTQLSNQKADTNVSQPVKKRGRFSTKETNPSSQLDQQLSSLTTGKNRLPSVFARDELDEYDSSEDEDYMAQVAQDEYMLDEDEQEEFEFVDEFEEDPKDANTNNFQTNLESSNNTNPLKIQKRKAASSSVFSQPISQPPPSTDNAPDLSSFHFSNNPNVAQFEVDDLDSTDDDESDGEIGQPLTSHHHVPQQFHREVLDEESDDENDMFDLEDSTEEEEDEDEEEDDENVHEAERDYYAEFLKELVTEDASNAHDLTDRAPENTTLNAESRQADAEARETIGRILDEDDDFDFDYLKASANVQEDPLEYRHDFHVPRKEVVQLLFTESNLRPQTRTVRPRKLQTEKSAENNSNRTVVPPPTIPHHLVTPMSVPDRPASASNQVQQQTSTVDPAISNNPAIAAVPGSQVQHTRGSNLPTSSVLSSAQVSQFKEQLAIFTQVLTYVHADTTRKVISEEEERKNAGGESEGNNSTSVESLKESSKRSESMLKRLVRSKQVSTDYHTMMSSHLNQLRPFLSQVIGLNYQEMQKQEKPRNSIYDLSALDAINSLLDSCNTSNASFSFNEVLKPFEANNRDWVLNALSKKRSRRQYSSSGTREGWFAWTAEDDNLLALSIAKYGRDIEDYSKDLLPHRKEDDCQSRVRYLSSRRCPDNAVKRQVMHVSMPLRKEELKLVEKGLKEYSRGNTEDPEVWKCIQRYLLPHRDWSHLQKLWGWREAKRKYKAKYRSRAKGKKKVQEVQEIQEKTQS